MQAKQNISFTSRMNIQPQPLTTPTGRQWWFATMAGCFVGGLILGITALGLSLLAAVDLVDATRLMSLTVVSMIVIALGLLLFGAHALDRMDEAERKAREESVSADLR